MGSRFRNARGPKGTLRMEKEHCSRDPYRAKTGTRTNTPPLFDTSTTGHLRSPRCSASATTSQLSRWRWTESDSSGRQIEVDWVALAVTGITTPMSRTRHRVSANASHLSVAWAPGGPRLPARAIASAEVGPRLRAGATDDAEAHHVLSRELLEA
jgi:hypothetical protein